MCLCPIRGVWSIQMPMIWPISQRLSLLWWSIQQSLQWYSRRAQHYPRQGYVAVILCASFLPYIMWQHTYTANWVSNVLAIDLQTNEYWLMSSFWHALPCLGRRKGILIFIFFLCRWIKLCPSRASPPRAVKWTYYHALHGLSLTIM